MFQISFSLLLLLLLLQCSNIVEDLDPREWNLIQILSTFQQLLVWNNGKQPLQFILILLLKVYDQPMDIGIIGKLHFQQRSSLL